MRGGGYIARLTFWCAWALGSLVRVKNMCLLALLVSWVLDFIGYYWCSGLFLRDCRNEWWVYWITLHFGWERKPQTMFLIKWLTDSNRSSALFYIEGSPNPYSNYLKVAQIKENKSYQLHPTFCFDDNKTEHLLSEPNLILGITSICLGRWTSAEIYLCLYLRRLISNLKFSGKMHGDNGDIACDEYHRYKV
jgi:hypothetical protein